MVREDIVQVLHEKHGLTKAKGKEAVEAVFNAVAEGLKRDGRVDIRGFGAFNRKVSKARKGRNPKTGEVFMVPQKYRVTFKASKLLKQIINGQSPDSVVE